MRYIGKGIQVAIQTNDEIGSIVRNLIAMDTSIAAGTRSSAQAIAFAQKRAMPKQILPAPVEAPVKMPETSVQQLRQRAEAEIAAQRLHAPKDSIQKDIVADREGLLVARRRAAQRMDFSKFDAHVQNMRNTIQAQQTYLHAKDVALDRAALNNHGILAHPLDYHAPKLPGRGDIDWAVFCKELKESGYNGPVCVEVEDREFEDSLDDRKESLRLSFEHLRPFL